MFNIFLKLLLSYFRDHFEYNIFSPTEMKLAGTENLIFIVSLDFWIFQNFKFYVFIIFAVGVVFTFFVNWVFQCFNIIFQSYECFQTRKQYFLIRRSLNLCFRSMLKISKMFKCCHFSSFLGVRVACFLDFSFPLHASGSKCRLPDTIVPGQKLCLSKTNCQTYFKFSFLTPKNVNVSLIENVQLAAVKCQPSYRRGGS